MDGNGRWATRRGRPRTAGHLAGARATRHAIEAAARLGVETLTLYAFSGDNWRRPATEVDGLMRLFRRFLASETARCVSEGIRLTVIGRRDRLAPALRSAIDGAEQATTSGRRMHLRIAIDYSARDAILRAARALAATTPAANGDEPARFAAALGAAYHEPAPAPDVDLLLRTGGEQRLSDFLLWEAAYAELWFTPTLWPDFGAADLAQALADFGRRDRRFGAIVADAAPARWSA
ncbi:isoprenyl transferase 1 [Gemmatimonadetes bacterium T265]|nr:isoprenyl transferase 1 [Gemmatimonadetes bacterium T265]